MFANLGGKGLALFVFLGVAVLLVGGCAQPGERVVKPAWVRIGSANYADNRLATGPVNAVAAIGGASSLSIGSAIEPSAAPGVSALFKPSSGTVKAKPVLEATGLPASAALNFVWIGVVGDLAQGAWNLVEKAASGAVTGSDGTLKAAVDVPEGVAGWLVLKVGLGTRVLAQVPYFVEGSTLQVNPNRLQAGDTFTLRLTTAGWRKLENGVGVVYDDRFVGHACEFNCQGDVTLRMVATGGAGTHLIDLYPMVYESQSRPSLVAKATQRSFAKEPPALALGYRVPAFRVAINVD